MNQTIEIRPHLILSTLSGLVWGVATTLIVVKGHLNVVPSLGGLVASPFIGYLVGLTVPKWHRLSVGGRMLMSLAAVYATALLFGVASALLQPLLQPTVSSAGFGDALQYLYGVAMFWHLVLWPLAAFNYWVIDKAVFPQSPRPA